MMSFLAVLGFSAMSIVPHPGAESWRGQMMLIAGAFLVGWLSFAFWARARQQRMASPPQWLSRLLVFVGVVYAVAIFFFMIT
jgi:hypothetical protein